MIGDLTSVRLKKKDGEIHWHSLLLLWEFTQAHGPEVEFDTSEHCGYITLSEPKIVERWKDHNPLVQNLNFTYKKTCNRTRDLARVTLPVGGRNRTRNHHHGSRPVHHERFLRPHGRALELAAFYSGERSPMLSLEFITNCLGGTV